MHKKDIIGKSETLMRIKSFLYVFDDQLHQTVLFSKRALVKAIFL